jgi:hypothetical protein
VKRIAKDIEEAGAAGCPYVIQQGRTEHIPNKAIKEDDIFSREELKGLTADAYHAADLKEVRIRSKEDGEEVIYKHGKRFS